MPVSKTAAAPQAKATLASLKGLTNQELFDLVSAYNPGEFDRVVSNGSCRWFTESGCQAINNTDLPLISKFLGLSMKVVFNKFDVPQVRSIWADSGIMETYPIEYGGVAQRIAGSTSYNPVAPAFLPGNKNAKDPDKYSPFKPREIDDEKERFFTFNMAYQNVITFADFPIRQAFLNPTGVSGYIALKINALMNGFKLYENAMIAKVFMEGVNSTKYPLKPTQVLKVDWPTSADTAPTDEQVRKFVRQLKKLEHYIQGTTATGEFNAAGYTSTWEPSDFKLLLRTGIEDDITTTGLLPWGLEGNGIKLPFGDIKNMNDFGGLEAYAESAHTTKLYPVYDDWGAVVDNVWSPTEGATLKPDGSNPDDAVVDNGENVFFKDPYADILGFIVQKGYIFKQEQSVYDVTPVFNPRNLKTSYIANKPMTGLNVDYYYNIIVLKNGNAQA